MNTLPVATRNLLIINIICFLAQMVVEQSTGYDLLSYYAGLHFVLSPGFSLYQPFSYMFLHGNFQHLLFNMLALWMFGRDVEPALGTKRFLTLYFTCGIGAAFCQELWQWGAMVWTMTPPALTVGASGAVYGVLLAFGMLFPNQRLLLLIPPIPIKAKYLVAMYAAIELFSSFSTDSNVAHFAHLGGMLFAWGLLRHWKRQYLRHTMGMQQRFSPRKVFQQTSPVSPPYTPDQAYNARQRQKETKVDAILDKIRQSGYDSLTEQEKKDLFDNSR